MPKYTSGEELLNKLYKDLFKTDVVINSNRKTQNVTPTEKITNYMSKLENIHIESREKENVIKILKESYYDKYIIKSENIPESYFELQQKIALERGQGHVTISLEQKKELIDNLIVDQKSTLNQWLDYFISTDTDMYPTWFKYWAFQGVVKLGSYNKETQKFSKRTSKTVNPFIDLEYEVLATVYDNVIKYIDEETDIQNVEIEKILEGGKFQKLYTYFLIDNLKNKKEIFKVSEGNWVKYDRGSDHMPLVNSLQGYGTGWCTAGEATAKSQLENGDFYVYYTKNEKGEVIVPRVAIRMDNSKIGEVRGIASNQNLEPEMIDIANEKLDDFPDKEIYKKKVTDMRKLTKIYTKNKNNLTLNIDELMFLYEVVNRIDGFGHSKDPRIDEIKKIRNINEDFQNICDNLPETFNRTLIFDELKEVKSLKLPHKMEGTVSLNGLKKVNGLVMPKEFKGSLILNNLESAEGLKLPEKFEGSIGLNSLTSSNGLIIPEGFEGSLNLDRLETAEGLTIPEGFEGSLSLNKLKTAEGLKLPSKIKGTLSLNSLINPKGLIIPRGFEGGLNLNGLKSGEGLEFLKRFKGSLSLNGLKSGEGLEFLKRFKGSLSLNGLKSAKGLKLPKKVNGSLSLNGLDNIDGFNFPQEINGSLNLSGLMNVKKIKLPRVLNGGLNISHLKTAKEIIFPKKIDGSLYMRGLEKIEKAILPEYLKADHIDLNSVDFADLVVPRKSRYSLSLNSTSVLKNIKLPKSHNGTLYFSTLKNDEELELPAGYKGCVQFRSLKSAEGLIIPEKFMGRLYLDGLESVEGLHIPKSFAGTLSLGGIKSAEGLKIPNKFKGSLNFKNLENSKGLILPENLNGSLELKKLKNADGLKLPKKLKHLSLGVETAQGLELPTHVSGTLQLCNLKSTTDLNLPKKVGGNLYLTGVEKIDNLKLPNGGGLYGIYLGNAEGIEKVQNSNLGLRVLRHNNKSYNHFTFKRMLKKEKESQSIGKSV